MKHLKILLLIVVTLGFTACSDENDGSNRGGSVANTTATTPTQTPPTTNPNTPSLYKSLALSAEQTTINKDENTTLKLIATSSDGTTKELDAEIEYIITPKESAQVTNNTLIAKQDGILTIQARAGNTLSNALTLDIRWVINGHTLPPKPDTTVNDSTLLGIDTNNNGVRDDVERWIYETYDHPIERGIFMQSARAYQKVIVDPSRAHEMVKYSDDVLSCEFYWTYDSKDNNEDFILDEYRDYDSELKKIQFNTLKRHISYEKFNAEFNGEVFGAPKASKDKCEFDDNGTLKNL